MNDITQRARALYHSNANKVVPKWEDLGGITQQVWIEKILLDDPVYHVIPSVSHQPKRVPNLLNNRESQPMVKITLEFTSIELAITALAGLRAGGVALATDPSLVAAAPAAAAAPATKPAAGGKGKDKTEPAASAPAPSPSAAPAAAPSPATTPAAASLDYEKDVKPAINNGVAVNKPAVKAVLADFGATNGTMLKPEQYADFLAKLANALKPAEDDLG